MSSNQILVTNDQADEFGRPITPADHVDRVRLYSAGNESGSVDFARLQLSHTDEVIRRLLILLHDIGKMAGINFMVLAYSQEDARSEFEQAYRYQTQEGKLKTHGKHSHPKHAWIGAVIVRELLTTVTRDYYTSPAGKFFASNRDQAVLIGAIFHHHDLIYRGEADQSQLTSWLFQELNAIRKTTIDHDPLLVVKILQQIVMLRFADTAATPAHRKHWEKNVAWLKLVPDILRQELAKETNSFKERGWFDLRAGLTSDPDLNESNYIEQVETSSNRIKTEIDLLERIIENYPSSHPEH